MFCFTCESFTQSWTWGSWVLLLGSLYWYFQLIDYLANKNAYLQEFNAKSCLCVSFFIQDRVGSKHNVLVLVNFPLMVMFYIFFLSNKNGNINENE